MAELSTDSQPSRVRVLLVDDEQLMRAGLSLMIDGAEGIDVVGEAADGAEALDQVERLDPDVVLMDIRMPEMNGIESTRRLQRSGTRAAVVVLTAFDTDDFLLDALRAGAVSFLLKDSVPQVVIQAVHEAAEGTARFSPAVLQRLVRLAAGDERAGGEDTGSDAVRESATVPGGAAPDTTSGPPTIGPEVVITEREWEVAQLVAQGLTNSEIADGLFLSLPTVKTHVGHLFDKLQVTNRVQLAIRVLELDG